MDDFMFDASIALTLVLATVVATLFHRVGLPAILGFMLTGALVGPSGFGILTDMHSIEAMAELGLVFLLFMVGLELSPDKLKAMRGVALKAGSLYMVFGTALLGLGIMAMNVPPLLAFILGGVLTISSTALVVKSLEDANQMGNPVGGVSLGTLIVQDIVVIPLLLLVPLTHTVYATAGNISWAAVGMDLGKAFVVLAATVILSLMVVPRVVDKLAHARSRELFTLSVFSLGIGMAFLTHLLGLSMEAGAFVGGLALSGSVYSKQVLSDSRPFRDVFAALFFVSLGAMLDARF
jgi:monovalent cation:H+ antiporter-2, CPA2 family